jgi:signal transduction histidine kinase
MSGHSFDQVLLFVFFIYGLAFFGLGVALALESGRLATRAEARILWSLAGFGLIHGTHEWLESFLLQAQAAGTLVPVWLPWLRLVLLLLSFSSLFLFGILTFQQPIYQPWIGMPVGAALLGIYTLALLASAVVAFRNTSIVWTELLDGMTRYLLAVPASALAVLALRFQVVQARGEGKFQLARYLTIAAFGFALYALSQLFVHPLGMFPAQWINSDTFQLFFHFPIQLLRAGLAVAITLGMLLATRELERGRRQELETVHQERLEALEQIRLESSRREELRRELLRHTVLAQEEERSRIARELHDETSQTLTAFSLNLATLEKLVTDQFEVSELVQKMRALSKQMSQGLYRLVHDLRPAQLDDLGLLPALEYLRDHHRTSGLEVGLAVRGDTRRLDPIVETVLFRVAQEALNNVARHAKTGQAEISLAYQTQDINLQIRDAGVGFDPSQSFAPPRGWGLAGMRERVEAIGGRLRIESIPGKGTLVEVVVAVFDLMP